MSVEEFQNLLTLIQVSKVLPHRPSVATLWRWRTRGVRGRILESIVIGGRVYVSVEALERFIEHCGVGPPPAQLRSPSRREREISRAEQDLVEAGI